MIKVSADIVSTTFTKSTVSENNYFERNEPDSFGWTDKWIQVLHVEFTLANEVWKQHVKAEIWKYGSHHPPISELSTTSDSATIVQYNTKTLSVTAYLSQIFFPLFLYLWIHWYCKTEIEEPIPNNECSRYLNQLQNSVCLFSTFLFSYTISDSCLFVGKKKRAKEFMTAVNNLR